MSDSLTTAVQSFDWTRKMTPDVRGFVTTWLEIGDRAVRYVSIAAPVGEAR